MAAPLMSQFLDFATALLHAADTALTYKPARRFVGPGSISPVDECCEGQLWVNVLRASPYADPRLARAANPSCQYVGWDVTLTVSIMRCVHVLDDDGNAPSMQELEDDAYQTHLDMTEVMRGLLGSREFKRAYGRLVDWVPVGPNGGCAGGRWTVTARLPWCEVT